MLSVNTHELSFIKQGEEKKVRKGFGLPAHNKLDEKALLLSLFKYHLLVGTEIKVYCIIISKRKRGQLRLKGFSD